MYYISTDKKVYAKTEKGFREVKITKTEDGTITIKDLKDTLTVDVECACTLEEVIARYSSKEEVTEEVTEEKPIKKGRK